MADAASRAQRAAALEERRRRLEELKKRRSRRDEDTAKVKASASANLDEYIDGLLSQPGGGAGAASSAVGTTAGSDLKANEAAATGAVASAAEQKPSSATGDDQNRVDDSRGGGGAASDNVIAEQAPAPLPKSVETFTVSTQTEDGDFPEPAEAEQDEEDATDDREKQSGASGEEDESRGAAAAAGSAKGDVDGEREDPKVLTAEEIEDEVRSKPFSSFITTASKKVERVLGTPLLSDLLVDYVGESDGAERSDGAKGGSEDAASRFLSSRQVYECPKWTSGRDATDLDWSPLHRELLLSTYHLPGSSPSSTGASGGPSSSSSSAAVSAVSPNDTSSSSLTPRSGELHSDGLALVWSLAMPSRPEHIFTCGSPVTAGRFHPGEAALVVGGCDSGQLVVWDVRAGRLPVQKSALTSVAVGAGGGASSKGHTHPVCSMEVIEGGSGLVTTSSDGRVNFWSLANLREPAETAQVGDSVSCFAVAPETEALLLGDENGGLHTVLSSSQSSGGPGASASAGHQRSSRKQVRKLEPSTDAKGDNAGHFGMVTALSTKTLKRGSSTAAAGSTAAGFHKGFLRGGGGLVLSSGVDWTVKLWAPAYGDSPLLSLVSHSYDYMSDVKWSPAHPSLFATASSNGTVGLWNLASSFEESLTGQEGIVVEPDAMSTGRGPNKLKWSADGRRVAVASADRVHVLGLSEDVARPKGDEDGRVMNQLMTRGLIGRQ